MPYKDKQKQYESQRKSRLARRAKIAELKSKPCTDCGGVFPFYVMDFDHIGEDKIFGVGTMLNKRSFAAVLEEIKKCELVCANCHRIRTHNRKDHVAKKWRKISA